MSGRSSRWRLALALLAGLAWACGPRPPAPSPTPAAPTPAFVLLPFASRVQPVTFPAADGVTLAGQTDWPPDQEQPPLVVILHHSGAVDRDSYQYLAARLVPAGYAVFRFDKRGTGRSGGVYGCCEADDALAAYRAAVAQPGYGPARVFIVAQSLGTRILAERFADFQAVQPPAGVALLSSLLRGEAVLSVRAPIHIIVADSEPDLAEIGAAAQRAHQAAYAYGASLFVAPHAEHTLFDISAGPIDWSAPDWPTRFSEDAWRSLAGWLAERAGRP
ncbi:MAG: alpha/beta hydrolase [Anaerolineales bacterium]|nr:alpha/beta hydrolase [Anaerolineales bacterium]